MVIKHEGDIWGLNVVPLYVKKKTKKQKSIKKSQWSYPCKIYAPLFFSFYNKNAVMQTAGLYTCCVFMNFKFERTRQMKNYPLKCEQAS